MDPDAMIPFIKTLTEDEPTPGTSGLSNITPEANSSSDESENENDFDPDLQSTEDYINSRMSEDFLREKKPDTETPKTTKPGKQKSRGRQTPKMPPHLKGLMGEANLRVARGDFKTAEQMCYEVIRQCPTASEPYLTLAEIYSAHPQISAEYQNIAAHLRPGDASQWMRLAQNNIEFNNYREAVVCFSRAIQAEPRNVDLHMKRLSVLEMLGDSKSILRCKIRLAYILKRKNYPAIIQLATEVAQEHMTNKDFGKAVDAMNVPFKRCRDKITPRLINMMLDALLLNGNFARCLDIFVEFCDLHIEIIIGENDRINVVSYEMPENLPVDLFIKFIICLTKLEAKHLVPNLINQLLITGDAEMIGDLYLDVAEACMSVHWPEEALKLLIPLVKSCNFSLAAVWEKHAECLAACGLTEPSIDSYYKVLELAPLHVEARRPLATLLLQLNRDDEALKVVTQNPAREEMDVRLLLMRLELLKKTGKYDDYLKAAELLLWRHCTKIRYPEEIRAVTYIETPTEKVSRVRKLRDFRGETLDEKPLFSTANEPTVEEEFQLFRDVLELCRERKAHTEMQKFAFMALTSTKFKNLRDELVLLAFFSCLHAQDTYHGYALVREMVIKYRHNHRAWNLFNALLQRSDDVRYNRAMIRMLRLYSTEPELDVLQANFALVGGNYMCALQKYMRFFCANPTPFYSFMMGVLMLNLYCQRGYEKEKTGLELHALFKHYANNRGEEAQQEVNYNLGRMYQILGINHLAVRYYNLALQCRHPLVEKYPNMLDLRREVAYNLHVIYKESGNLAAARKVLIENIIV